jgi:hypothetical protein
MNNCRNIEIGFGQLGFANAIGFVSKTMVQAAFVNFGINGNSANAHFSGCPDNSDSYFATVGYE